MIDYSRYNKQVINEGKSNQKTKTTLEASFTFKDEVAPVNREKIFGRIWGKKEPGRLFEYPLFEYLREVEKINYNFFYRRYYDSDHSKDREIKLTKLPWGKLGLKLKISSSKNLDSHELIDLNSLNRFILTGKYPIEKD